MDKIYFTRHDSGVTLFRNSKCSTVESSHPNYLLILDALKRRQYDKIDSLVDIGSKITKFGVSHKLKGRKIYVEKGQVFYTDKKGKAKVLAGPLVDRILTDLNSKSSHKFADALLAFMDNIQKNKLKDIRQELYEWLMSGKTPITYDGCFLAYKRIRPNYKDIFTNTFDNSPGKIVQMPQDKVDLDRTRECSMGLHFCSHGYLSHYSSCYNDRVIIVKVNPRHVFAIPTDYQFQKGRCSQYYVVGEFTGNFESEAFHSSFVDEDSKFASMPDVKFATGWLRPSLKTLGESLGLVVDGKVTIIDRRGRYVAVKEDKRGDYIDVLGTPVFGSEAPKVLSFETKSAREAVRAAVRKIEK